MIISLFKKNNAATFLVMVFIGLLLWVDGFYFYELQQPDATCSSPLFAWFTSLLPNSNLFKAIIGFVFVVVQALMINYAAEKHRIVRKKKMLPGLVYIALMSIYAPMFQMHPALIANFFLILALSISVGEYSGKKAILSLFNLGLFISLSGLIFFPAFFLFLALFFQKDLWSAGRMRGFFAYLIGFLTPLFFVANYYFHLDILDTRVEEFATNFHALGFQFIKPEVITGILFSYVGLIAILSFGYLSIRHSAESTITMRLRLVNILIFFLFAVLALFFSGTDLALTSGLVFVPLSFTVALWLIELKKKLLAEVAFLVLLFLIILSKYSNFLF